MGITRIVFLKEIPNLKELKRNINSVKSYSRNNEIKQNQVISNRKVRNCRWLLQMFYHYSNSISGRGSLATKHMREDRSWQWLKDETSHHFSLFFQANHGHMRVAWNCSQLKDGQNPCWAREFLPFSVYNKNLTFFSQTMISDDAAELPLAMKWMSIVVTAYGLGESLECLIIVDPMSSACISVQQLACLSACRGTGDAIEKTYIFHDHFHTHNNRRIFSKDSNLNASFICWDHKCVRWWWLW